MLYRQPLFRFAIVCALLVGVLPAVGHETDQYTMPAGREFADIGDYLTKYMYDAVKGGVDRQNSRINRALDGGEKGKTMDDLESVDQLASSVNRQFPVALSMFA